MGFIEATKTCFRKYIVTSGRASRSEYWWFFLAIILMSIVAGILDFAIFGIDDQGNGPAGIIVSLGTFIPSITAAIRRLHDTGKAWYYLLVPLVGILIGVAVMFLLSGLGTIAAILGFLIMAAGVLLQLWWLIKPSDPGTNAFGPNPFDGGPDNVQEVFE